MRTGGIRTARSNSSLTDFLPESGSWRGDHVLVECRRALTPVRMQGVQYALNPYGGCEHGCLWCRSPKATHSDPSSWTTVRVRSGIAERLSRELPAVATIAMGTAGDPDQYAERRFMLSRSCLEAMRPGRNRLAVFTKSDLVTRDADLLLGLDAKVVMTFSGTGQEASKRLEPQAPLPGERLDALADLVASGVRASACVSPVTSLLEGMEGALAEAIASAGAKEVFAHGLALRDLDASFAERTGILPSDKAMEALRSECARVGLDFNPPFSV